MPNENIDLLILDLAEWARAARLRGFSEKEIVAAVTGGAMAAMSAYGITREQMVGIVDVHYGQVQHVRPTAKA